MIRFYRAYYGVFMINFARNKFVNWFGFNFTELNRPLYALKSNALRTCSISVREVLFAVSSGNLKLRKETENQAEKRKSTLTRTRESFKGSIIDRPRPSERGCLRGQPGGGCSNSCSGMFHVANSKILTYYQMECDILNGPNCCQPKMKCGTPWRVVWCSLFSRHYYTRG
ncbi:hypothetical protein CEXT_593341 [Caerostris extrusa]|uniref:Uncharacterized protein n=1 Tax=Caerostris extrusa TaxID=172846 RepID=A0AAV4TSC4_CAEEX|nr:hypothetical protein CEXT_593341 [Caerostris extrusa]